MFLDGELAGYVAGRFDPEELTSIMTNDGAWGELGPSGETYVVAADTLMRSDARPFIEDQSAYIEQVEAAGTATADEVRSMRFFDTTVLNQPIDYRLVEAAFDGRSEVETVTNYLGEDVLSNSRVLDIDGLEWVVFAEAGVDVIREPIDVFVRNLLIAIAVFIVVVTFLAVRSADRLLEPLRLISTRLRTIHDGGEPTALPRAPERQRRRVRRTRSGHRLDARHAPSRTATARRSTDERRVLLRRLLPAPVAERAEAGDRDVVEQVSMATVAVLVIGGLGTLVTAGTPDRARELLDRFVDEADRPRRGPRPRSRAAER